MSSGASPEAEASAHLSAASSEHLAQQAAARIAELSGVDHHDLAVVLGSGWAGAAAAMGDINATFTPEDVPGFRPPAVPGHQGRIQSIQLADSGKNVLVFGTRTHFYEGHGAAAVAHPIRTAAATGCSTLVLTNGCGSLVGEWAPGTTVLIKDHINLTGATPLQGATFVDLTDLYAQRLRDLARVVQPDLPEGVYVQFPGPQYETPAEVRMAGVLGGDLVGMSTALEAIAARHAGMEILGISLVTNAAAGMSDSALDHSEVVDAGKAAADRIGPMLAEICRTIAAQ